MSKALKIFLKLHGLQQFSNEFIFFDNSRDSGLTPHGEDMLATWNAAMDRAVEVMKEEKVGANKDDHPTDRAHDNALNQALTALEKEKVHDRVETQA